MKHKRLYITILAIVALMGFAYLLNNKSFLDAAAIFSFFIFLFCWYVPNIEERAYKRGQEDMARSLGKVKNPFHKEDDKK